VKIRAIRCGRQSPVIGDTFGPEALKSGSSSVPTQEYARKRSTPRNSIKTKKNVQSLWLHGIGT
jgi:hypothetical protein